jgi:hypothetical protein
MVNWANMFDEQIINIEPVVAEIRMFLDLILWENEVFV